MKRTFARDYYGPEGNRLENILFVSSKIQSRLQEIIDKSPDNTLTFYQEKLDE